MTEKNWLQKLTKSDSDKWIGGVCGGLGEHSPIPSWVWRVLFVLFFFGPGLFIYILLWIFVPPKSNTQEQ
jgi:phage shock protein C